MKEYYDNLVDAVNDLKSDGYINDFNLKSNSIFCKALDLDLKPSDFSVVKSYRFEDDSSPDDSSALYLIASNDEKVKGMIIDYHGAYSSIENQELLEMFK
jgi:hypothetical protein